jgi:ribosomal protein L12E/L44/L45/RPP1/RPP2
LRRTLERRRRLQTLQTLFQDAGLPYTIKWLNALCTDLQTHVDVKDAAFAVADAAAAAAAAPPAPKPAVKAAKPPKAERHFLPRAALRCSL